MGLDDSLFPPAKSADAPPSAAATGMMKPRDGRDDVVATTGIDVTISIAGKMVSVAAIVVTKSVGGAIISAAEIDDAADAICALGADGTDVVAGTEAFEVSFFGATIFAGSNCPVIGSPVRASRTGLPLPSTKT